RPSKLRPLCLLFFPLRPCRTRVGGRWRAATAAVPWSTGTATADAASDTAPHFASPRTTARGRGHATRSHPRRSYFSRRAVHRLPRRRPRTALLHLRQRRVLRGTGRLLPYSAETERRARVRSSGDPRVRCRTVPRGDDGVSAGRHDQGLPVRDLEGLPEPQARRAAGALPDDHSDRAGDGEARVSV